MSPWPGSHVGQADCLHFLSGAPHDFRLPGDSAQAWSSVLPATSHSRDVSPFSGFWQGTLHHPITTTTLYQVDVLGGVTLESTYDGSVSLKRTPIKPSLQQISQQDFGGDKALVIFRAQPYTHFMKKDILKGKEEGKIWKAVSDEVV